MDTIKMVQKFHGACGIRDAAEPWVPVLDEVERAEMKALAAQLAAVARLAHNCGTTYSKGASVAFLRVGLIAEELGEMAEALAVGDVVETLDALADLDVVTAGSYLQFGLGPVREAAVREVHASNMSKVGLDGKVSRREDGKILKPPGYRGPDLALVLLRHAAQKASS